MLFVIATAAVIVATLLLIPIVKVGSTSGARRCVLCLLYTSPSPRDCS